MISLRKALSLILCLAMVLGCLAACSEQEDTPTATTQAATESVPETTEPDRSGEQTLDINKENSSIQSVAQRADSDTAAKEHTLMVYMVGSDLESEYNAASKDLGEMLASDVDTSKVNVVVYTGGAYSWGLPISSDCNNILTMSADGSELLVYAQTDTLYNTGEAQTLYDFLEYAHAEFPAENYSLIFWDHGGGSLYGFGSDMLFNKDGLFLTEIKAAMEASSFAQEKLAFVGFDACLMATVETAALFADYAQFFVASEETEPGCGWDYTCLSTLNSGSIADLIDEILSTYETSMRSLNYRPKYTLSCLDLSAIDQTFEAMDGLFHTLRQSVVDGNYAAVAKARQEGKDFGMSSASKLSEACDLTDLLTVAELLADACDADLSPVEDALDALVVDQVTNIKEAAGVAIYFPWYNKTLYQDGSQLYSTIPTPEGYLSFLEVYTDQWLDGEMDTQWASEVEPTTDDKTADYLYLTLSEEELSQVGRVYYNVFRQEADGESYCPVLTDCIITPEANGDLRIPTNPYVLAVTTDLEPEAKIFQVSQMDATTFVSQYAVLMASDDVLTGGIEPVQINLSNDGGALEITGIVSRDPDSTYNVRTDIDPADWNEIAYFTYPMYPTTEASSELLLPWESWERDDSFYLMNSRYDNEFTLGIAPLSQFEGNYYAQMMVEDLCGNVIISVWTELCSNPAAESVQKTENGEMTFSVYEDHAVLTGYTGTDIALQIPETVEGKPVTVIGERALRNVRGLTEVTIPGTVTRIEAYAFAGFEGTQLVLPEALEAIGFKAFTSSDLTGITLPKNLRYLPGDAFAFASDLTAIESESSNYPSVDGVVFSADGTTLVAYPCGGATEYVVPDTVQTIGYGAFSGNLNLTGITLPEGLVTIESFGFGYCENIADLILPESLEYIGHSAFGTNIGMPKSDSTKTVTIGENVRYIGLDAFNCFNLTAYEVDRGNEWFCSVDGCLLNASGTKLISVPVATEGTFEVPFGVSFLDWHCLQDCNGITELILSDTVVAIDLGAGAPNNLQKLHVNASLTYWGNQEDFAGVPEIDIDPENPNFN